MELSKKINKFLEKGNNKRIVKIIDAALIGILGILTLVFVVKILNTKTDVENYALSVVWNLLFVIIFGGIDTALVLFTKPLFGFTSVVENYRANKMLKEREKAEEKEAQEFAKERIRAAHAAAKAEKAAAKAAKKAAK